MGTYLEGEGDDEVEHSQDEDAGRGVEVVEGVALALAQEHLVAGVDFVCSFVKVEGRIGGSLVMGQGKRQGCITSIGTCGFGARACVGAKRMIQGATYSPQM